MNSKGDKMTQKITVVRRLDHDDNMPWVVDILANQNNQNGYVQPGGFAGRCFKYEKKESAIMAEKLYLKKNPPTTSAGELVCGDCELFLGESVPCDKKDQYFPIAHEPVNLCEDFKPKIPVGENIRTGHEEDTTIRTFDSGATRDTVEGKLDYVKALCPLVLRRYVQYLDKHRLQPDGGMRDFDNWKQGMPRETYHSSKGRHFFADWLLEEGYAVEDNHGPVDEEDALCGELFNTMGKLREILRAKLAAKEKE